MALPVRAGSTVLAVILKVNATAGVAADPAIFCVSVMQHFLTGLFAKKVQ